MNEGKDCFSSVWSRTWQTHFSIYSNEDYTPGSRPPGQHGIKLISSWSLSNSRKTSKRHNRTLERTLDHNPVVVVKIRFRQVKKPQLPQRIDVRNLRNQDVCKRTTAEMKKLTEELQLQSNQDVKSIWKIWREKQSRIQMEVVGTVQRAKRNEWMTPEILAL